MNRFGCSPMSAGEPFWTIVAEAKVPKVDDFFATEQQLMANESLRNTMADYHDLVESGRREIYRIENDVIMQVGTAVIGGGQAGLAVGYHLMRRRLPFVILDDNDRIGDAWRKRWDSLRLFTPGRYDGLPGMPFPGSPSSYPTKDEAADYLEAYARDVQAPCANRRQSRQALQARRSIRSELQR